MNNFSEIIGIQRGRNHMSHKLVRSITRNDYFFDFRGIVGGSKINLLWLLLKAWICSREIPRARIYLIEGALCFWVGYFLKKRYPNSRLVVIVPEPAFYLDQRKGKLQRFFFKFRMKAMLNSIDLLVPNSMMIYRDATKQFNQEVPYYHLKYPIKQFPRIVDKSDKNILFVIERPEETGYVKGYDQVLEIFSEVEKIDPEAKLFLIGTGTETLTFNSPNIRGMGRMDIEKAYALGSTIISPARYDAFLMVIPEAASAGLIPITSESVGAKDLFAKDFSENVIPLEDREEWVKRIIESFSLSKEYRDMVYNHFDQELKSYREDAIFPKFKQKIQDYSQLQ